MNVFHRKGQSSALADDPLADDPLAAVPKSKWQRIWPVLACGAGLFAEGYVQSVIGSVGTILGIIYGSDYKNSPAKSNVAAISFVGTVLGQLVFGYTSDKWSRRNSLLVSTIILIVFAALCAGSYGAGGNIQGMFAALTAYRFFLGTGIGGEYPAGSVSAAEASGELKSGTRNFWFIMFTNVAIDWGFVIGAFVPYVLVLITTEANLGLTWRLSLGLGVVPPLVLFLLRLKLKEPEEFKRESMRDTQIPYGLVLRYYWFRLLIVGLIWFLYDFSAYAFGIYSSTIVYTIIGNAPLYQTFGWNTVINLFYIPGAMLGGPVSDWIGPRYTLAIGVTLQAVVGYLMAGLYGKLAQPQNIAAFAVVYGIFLSLGEVGPGNNIGLIASKTCATGVRGQYYGVAAAVGKVGAFIGTYVFPYIIAAGGDDANKQAQYPFWVAGSLCILSALLAIFFIPHIGQDTIVVEDRRFRDYLESNGWDTRQMGFKTADGDGDSAVEQAMTQQT